MSTRPLTLKYLYGNTSIISAPEAMDRLRGGGDEDDIRAVYAGRGVVGLEESVSTR